MISDINIKIKFLYLYIIMPKTVLPPLDNPPTLKSPPNLLP